MKFKLTPMFTKADIDKATAEFMERVNRVTENEMMQILLEFITDARNKTKAQGGFDDQTGVLRSSIGGIVTYNGAIRKEDFEVSAKGTNPTEGLGLARKLAESLIGTIGWGIITVVGAEYASWVEAKGYDVITGSTLGAEGKLRKALENVLKAFA